MSASGKLKSTALAAGQSTAEARLDRRAPRSLAPRADHYEPGTVAGPTLRTLPRRRRYLDKPLRLHTLFQAICRTNRRWTNPLTGHEKHYELIVDYVGLGNQIAQALRDADPERRGRRPVDVDALAEEFVAALYAALERFDRLDRRDTSFAALQGMWEFLEPSPITTAHPGDYR